ncbi:MAG TPA: hypothetical protein VFS92_11005 [Planctomycetota bacterium]|nr:hypothetical protein [Planctomycetota bacterium]
MRPPSVKSLVLLAALALAACAAPPAATGGHEDGSDRFLVLASPDFG